MSVCTTGYYHLSSGNYVLFFNMNAQEQMLTITVSPHGERLWLVNRRKIIFTWTRLRVKWCSSSTARIRTGFYIMGWTASLSRALFLTTSEEKTKDERCIQRSQWYKSSTKLLPLSPLTCPWPLRVQDRACSWVSTETSVTQTDNASLPNMQMSQIAPPWLVFRWKSTDTSICLVW